MPPLSRSDVEIFLNPPSFITLFSRRTKEHPPLDSGTNLIKVLAPTGPQFAQNPTRVLKATAPKVSTLVSLFWKRSRSSSFARSNTCLRDCDRFLTGAVNVKGTDPAQEKSAIIQDGAPAQAYISTAIYEYRDKPPYLFTRAETPKTLELALMWIHPLFYLQPNNSSKEQIPH